MATLNTRIVLRNDTAEKWLANNPVLLMGEAGVETDTGLIKIGNGTSTWAALDYVNKFEAVSAAMHYEEEAQPIEGTDPVEYETNEQVLARFAAVGKADDVLIIKRPIAGDAVSHTAYIHNGTTWAAMDGNYNADNIYFDADLMATAPIGVVTIPTTGSATIAAKGKNLNQVLASILAERKTPSTIKPTVSISFTNDTKAVEAGTTITPAYKASLSAGSYTYGPATGVVATKWTIKDNLSVPNTSSLDEGTMPDIKIGDQTGDCSSYSLNATVEHTAGAIPQDNFGDDYPAGQIAANSAAAANTATKITCYRNYFYGSLPTSSAEQPLTSAVIRDFLTAGGAYKAATPTNSPLVVNAGAEGAKRVVVAYPKNTTRSGLKSVTLPSTLNMVLYDPATPTDNVYKAVADVNVEGADGYTAIPYTVFVYEPAEIGADEVHNIWLA